jgi:hypothetical protein
MGVSGQHHAPAAPTGKGPPVPIGQEAGWAPEPVWTQRLEEKSSASVGEWTPVVQSVVRHYTDWATPAPAIKYTCLKYVKDDDTKLFCKVCSKSSTISHG